MLPRLIEMLEGLQPRLRESRLKPLLQAALVALLAVITIGCGSGGTKTDARAAVVAAGPDPAAIAAYGQALATLHGGDEAAAEAKFQSLAQTWPDYSGPLVNLAMIKARRGELEPATALLQRAVAVCASCATPWNELGVIQRQQGRFADAEQSYLKAIAADSAYANAYFNLGVLYELYLQRPELALSQYGRFRELQAGDPAANEVDKWIVDLTRRTKAVERSAQAEGSR